MNIEKLFLEFFQEKNHKIISSFPLSIDDPTLLFVNSGMAPLKDYFLNNQTAPAKAIATSQSCLRVGGKHNDLENIGHSNRHHTYFKMLGNFSFGAYNREQALQYALEFLKRIQLENLLFTYHKDDQEAKSILSSYIEEKYIIELNNDDNKWSMGDFGPFGYSIEIFWSKQIECTENNILSEDCIEIWNIVYMAHEKCTDHTIKPLFTECIDTGMGLERIQSIIEKKSDTYMSSIFEKQFALIGKLYKIDKSNIRQRIIVDHTRAIEALLQEDIVPNANGHGYIMRMLIRKLAAQAYLINKNTVKKLISLLFNNNSIVNYEVESLLKCINNGIETINQNLDSINTEMIFKLYETYGFPIEIAEEIFSINIDDNKMKQLIHKHKIASQSNMQSKQMTSVPNIISEFVGYDLFEIKTKVNKCFTDKDNKIYVILSQTPFYGEGGGQQSDHGWIEYNNIQINVLNVIQHSSTILHEIDQMIEDNIEVIARINIDRRNNLAKAHSATHMLNHILRNEYNAQQSGSLVKENEFRFDIITDKSIDTKFIENKMNRWIIQNENRNFRIGNTEQEIKNGAVHLRSQKYPNESRVISIGNSCELCCGTHVQSTNEIEYFMIESAKSIAKNIIRINAFISQKAYDYLQKNQEIISSLSRFFSCSRDDILYKIAIQKENYKKLNNESKLLRRSVIQLSIKEKIYANINCRVIYINNADIKDLISNINNDYDFSIATSQKFIIIKGREDLVTKYGKILQKNCNITGSLHKSLFKGSLNMQSYETFILLLDKILV